jgi:hypothetical protein
VAQPADSLQAGAASVKYFRPGAYRDRLTEYLRATGREQDAAGNIRCPSGTHPDSHPSCKVYPDGLHCFACGFHADIYTLAALDCGLPDCRGENWRRVSTHIEKVLGLPSPFGERLPGGRRALPVTKSAVFISSVRERESEIERAVRTLSAAIEAGDLEAVKRRDEMLVMLMGWYGVDLACEHIQKEAAL